MRKIVISMILTLMIIGLLDSVPYTTMGQLRSPDAYVLPHKAAELTYTNYLRRKTDSFTDLEQLEYIPMGMLNFGIYDRVALGVWGGDKLGFVNLKIKVIEETVSIPQVSVGIDNVFSPIRENSEKTVQRRFNNNPEKGFYEKNSPYVVFSKSSVVKGMTGLPLLETVFSVGIGGNKFRGQHRIAKKFEGLFGSVSIKPEKNTSLTFENDGFNLNAGAQYSYRKFSFKISYVGLEEQENNRIGIGISYLFDKYADSKRRPSLLMEEDSKTSSGSDVLKSPIKGRDINANRDLLEELKKLREQREQGQKLLEDIKKQLKEIEESTQE